MRRFTLALALASVAPAAIAACPEPAAIDAYIADRDAARPAARPIAAGASLDDALCAQAMLVAALVPALGPVVGYKAGLTSEKAQSAFGVTEPVLGTLLAGMMLEPGASVAVAKGVRPLFEADLLVEIADPAVNAAKTPAEVLAHIAGVRPFLELPDLAVAREVTLDGPVLTATNVGAWKGVVGDLIAVPAEGGVEMLAAFTARVADADGAALSVAPGAAVLGHPLEAVIWVAGMLAQQGKALKAGDLVSVGSIGPLHPMKPGMTVSVTYEGLPGTPAISARFE